MTGTIPYYCVNSRNGQAYWSPTKPMKAIGFSHVSLGPAGPNAEELAKSWNVRWYEARKEDRTALGVRACLGTAKAARYVYFLQVSDRIKIGTSRTPLTRVRELAGAASGRVKRIVVVEGSRGDEKRLHARFQAYRTGGEWFVACRPLVLTLTRCAAAGGVVHDEEGTEIVSESNRQRVPRSRSEISQGANAL